ncbi:MAG: GGDEF domain-containing protein, partial [Gemmatimonadetes bacterium]|nr:GGDEF domain-containing protein [Gemmatimonadota bacterium]
ANLVEEFFCGPDPGPASVRLRSLTSFHFRWPQDRVEEVLGAVQETLPELAELLAVEIDPVDVESLLVRAREQMLSVGLQVAVQKKASEDRISELAIQNEALKRTAQLDPLTGLANRAEFDRRLDECVTHRRNGEVADALGLLMIDVDHFKRVNDEHGHMVGDEALKMVGRVLGSVSRQSDTCIRYGGEEFAIIMPRTTFAGLESLSERIRAAIAAETVRLDGDGRLSITVSLGGACIDRFSRAEDAGSLVEIADQCLYQAKADGRNRSVFYPFSELPAER